ncbi:MAG TPA: mechanosensitive ion channel family protein [Candidatus Cloacimonadota bacterium]|nr:mechanosensitive ion channel family protein [Candidatus Cloacimonadota bacterium]HPS38288.1 mechanosensitive ion channel family protein [Candidatus Cloacimonadota bacterium]
MTLAISQITDLITGFLTPERLSLAIRVILILGIGIPLIRLIRKLTRKATSDRLSAQSGQLVQRTVYYAGILIILVMVLNEFGFKLSALLGAAGVFGLAIGFASQTSISNIISGIFLISEKPFVIGDMIEIAGTLGEIQSIDLLSIKLKTTDNRFVRVPNETMIKSEVINLTHYNVRRVNINVTVAYGSDLPKVLTLLGEVAQREELALQELGYIANLEKFGEFGIEILFGVWCKTTDYALMKNSLMISIKDSFTAQGIEIPYPHLELRTSPGSATRLD